MNVEADVGGLHKLANSPPTGFLADKFESPIERISRGLQATEARDLAMDAALGTSRSVSFLGAYDELRAARKAFDPLGSFHSRWDTGSHFGSHIVGGADPLVGHFGIPPSVASAMAGLKPLTIDSALGDTIGGLRQAMDEAFSPLRGLGETLTRIEDQHRDLTNSLMGVLCSPMGDITRTAQWMGAFSGDVALHGLQPGGPLTDVVHSMQSSVRALESSFIADRTRMSSILGLGQGFVGEFETTSLKMSVLAGINEISPPRSPLQDDAYRDLFGDWRVHTGLPKSFWNDRRERTKAYEEAEVDQGLIHATPGMALEIMIESGLATGMRVDDSVIAVVALGDVSMTVRSRTTRGDAYAAISVFEEEMRAFISQKMEASFGENWFKQRATNLVGKAKAGRRAAMERGERFLPLIEFTDLGDLAGLILSKGNWDDIFGDVFGNRDAFSHDMQRLVAVRRPTMHTRPVDGVLLVEMLCVMRRLSNQIIDNGSWRVAAELDR
jgi:hypothetical protein